jgi:hypothetical protein
MIRTQIQLSSRQAGVLKQMSAAQSVSMAELIRRAVDRMIAERREPDRDEIRKRAAAAAGRFNSGVTDLSERHDDYLAEAFGDEP